MIVYLCFLIKLKITIFIPYFNHFYNFVSLTTPIEVIVVKDKMIRADVEILTLVDVFKIYIVIFSYYYCYLLLLFFKLRCFYHIIGSSRIHALGDIILNPVEL